MCYMPRTLIFPAFSFIALTLVASSVALAQLEVTEVMFNPLSANDTAWEWLEVRNNGSVPVDLNGAFAGRVGDEEALIAAVSNFEASNTVIPANGVAVLYDGFLGLGNPSNFNDQHFRDAWGLSGSVPLIAVNSGFPQLTNGGTAFGFWADSTAYAVDVADQGAGPVVTGLTNTLFDLDYTSSNGFPASTNGSSMRWSGNGDYRVGSNWALSAAPETGVVTSSLVAVGGATNSTADIGSPGSVPAGPAAAGLLITEIMYNPRSLENNAEWEWVEIHNNTGSDLNFETTPYYLDDDDGGALNMPNINSGIIANGTTAILFNGGQIDVTDMQAAWDPLNNGTNFIPVTAWPGFGNSDDLVALWDNESEYLSDETAEATTNAVVAVAYTDNDDDPVNPWPLDDGNGSIYLMDLNAADNNLGANWGLSAFGDGVSTNATAINGTITVHPGGDVGSPGAFTEAMVVDVDLDDDGDVDGADFLAIQRTDPSLIPEWESQYGSGSVNLAATTAVPEPTTFVLVGLALTMLPVNRWQRS